MTRSCAWVAALLLAAAATACAANGDERAIRAQAGSGPVSVVQLGDSIASGEGTLYGYTYDSATQEWGGGNLDAVWPGPYPLCHDSPDAYGAIVAQHFGAAFTQLACTGATFANGISAAETDDGTQLRPAEFGNWETQQDLNAAYDDAKPDLVLVTLGADDLAFTTVVKECIKNSYEHYFHLAALDCTAKNPGDTITSDVTNALPTLEQDYGTLVDWIAARAKARGVPAPKVVFTTYPDPLPANGAKCPDTSWLYPRQVKYLSSLVGTLNAALTSTINGLDAPNVRVADASGAYTANDASHVWCSPDPWSYGLSLVHISDPESFESQAPFHPTPDGQASIAEHVIPAVTTAFGYDTPPGLTTTTR